MLRVRLLRTIEGIDGTFGHLVHGDFHVHTAEPEAPRPGNKGRIPPGTYQVEWEPTGRFKGYVLRDVPGFEAVEIHVGNIEEDTHGCILPGMRRGILNGKEAVLDSHLALARFEQHLGWQEFELVIEEDFYRLKDIT